MKRSKRTQTILETAVRDFIRNGRPITSQILYEGHNFGVKPATIRIELNALSGAGYFYQTHPSGGRFPTNKAFHFFVDKVRERAEESLGYDILELTREFLRAEHMSFIEELADQLKVASVGYDTDGVYASGLSELLSRLEVGEKRDLVGAVQDCELLPTRLREELCDVDDKNWPIVFIGRSPVTKSDCLSVIAGTFRMDDGEFTLAIIGPKRMDYGAPIAFFKSVEKMTHSNK